jgi:Homeodomain-like domain
MQQIEWRRYQVLELSSKGYSQSEIARTLQIDRSTISRDSSYLREQSKQNIRKYIDERLPEEYEKCLVGISSILKEAWNTVNSKDGKDKLHALSLAKDCYSMKLELLTNATVIEDALKFVKEHKDTIKLNEIDTEFETTKNTVF